MADYDALGPGNVVFTALGVAEGTATPEEARRLIAEFVRQASVGNVEPRLIEHVRDCFAGYLQGKRLD